MNGLGLFYFYFTIRFCQAISWLLIYSGMLSVAVIMIGVCFRHKFTIEPPRSVDPLKLVIKYAWKHKYPERPTYTDDPNTTSRLDFGKKRYGGPFTSDQVENNIKSFGRILAVLPV